ncbi:sensor histidine kinase [Comamonas composti]|uniref:sensor histidine kinase n=1 Tax=Comamonas composti TaxID=408558 RepID=UPI0003F6F8B9|nr:ATP-binding protein [Comamonas composti]
MLLLCCHSVWAQDCIQSVQSAREVQASTRPVDGWESVTLPDAWSRRWPAHDGVVWYRVVLQGTCEALGIDGIGIAGEVFINGDLLWSDASMSEPLSRSWNVPRWWRLPPSALHADGNTVWVRVAGRPGLWSGLGALRLGDAATVAARHDRAQWRQRTIYLINAVLAGMAATLFLVVWGLRRQERAYGWFALMSLCWLVYLSTYLASTPWPFADSLDRARFSLVALIGYVLCACMFTLRFGEQHLPRAERGLWLLAALGAAAAWLAPQGREDVWWAVIWQGALLVFLLNGLQFQWHAWRPGRPVAQRLLALCWLAFVIVALFALGWMPDAWQVARNWAALSGIATVALVMLLLAGQLAQQMRSAERFRRELEARVAEARTELAQLAAREHAQALDNAKLQERMQIAHDLHDGLGGSLVRGMALVEQAQQPLPNDRVLSLLKLLRDDLRQVIDHGSSAGATVPETPVQWIAPLRHRFTRIFDETGVQTRWDTAPLWQRRPSALQCLGLTRLMEEALSNVIKHSQAQRVTVECAQPRADVFSVRIEDDGCGFDVQAVRRAGLSVGMRSMAARAERMGAVLEVESGPGGTVVTASLLLEA